MLITMVITSLIAMMVSIVKIVSQNGFDQQNGHNGHNGYYNNNVFNDRSKVNIINPAYTKKLDL